jgi:predicted ATPase
MVMDQFEVYLREASLDTRAIDVLLYPFNLPAVRRLTTISFDPKITFIIGENGTGKSTLVEALAVACGLNAEGGSRNFRFASRETHSSLSEHLKVVRGARRQKDAFFLRAESFYNVATTVDQLDQGPGGPRIINSYGGTSLHEQSHGESFMSLIEHRLRGEGLYFMDEPEAALSVQRQMKLLVSLHRLIQLHSQFVIATHSPIILSYPGALIYEVTSEGLKRVSYEDTDQYQLTKYFLNNYKRMIGEIIN